MAKDKKGFFDWLVEDICNTIEIKGAVEATRDENGRVDKWAATGLSMGLGHTSDDEMATLAGFLGAEGAFDADTVDIDRDAYIPPMPKSEPVRESAWDEETQAIYKDLFSVLDDLKKIVTEHGGAAEEPASEEEDIYEAEDEEEEFEDTLIGTNMIYAEDMRLLSEAGYDEYDLERMEPQELRDAMEDAGVDTLFYDFD